MRICGDYKISIHQSPKIEKYPILRINEQFASLAGGKTFTKLDLSHAYLQITLKKECVATLPSTLTRDSSSTIVSHLPLGISSAPSIIQQTMENLPQGISGVCVYIDDILVPDCQSENHLSILAQVLERLESAGVHMKWEKINVSSCCQLFLTSDV